MANVVHVVGTGTIGEPGNRAFFLQAKEGRRVVSVALEKAQVAVLAERLGLLLTELGRHGISEAASDAVEPDEQPLDEHELRAVVHLVLLHAHEHLEPRLRRVH